MASRNVTAAPKGKPSGKPFNARFVNVARQAGLKAPVIYGNPDRADYIFEAAGCGAAFLDYDNDGWLDIIVLTGRGAEATSDSAVIRLYRNNRDGTFADVSKEAGIGRQAWATGITVGDYDNDGFDDVFITCRGSNILFHNNGNGTFSDVTEKAGLVGPAPRYATGCTWIDYDRDGRLDLFISHYTVFDESRIPVRGKDPGCQYQGVPVFCGPAGLPQQNCLLYRNNGDGTFTDVSGQSGIAAVKPGYPLTAVAADFDGDGWPDIYVACDTSPGLYFHNNGDGTFTEQGLERGVSLSEDGQNQAGMGLGIGDFDGDGFLDIFKTHFRGDTEVLYRNNGRGYFRDLTLRAGLGVENRFVAWGAAIADFDNDGLADLFFTTGMVYPEKIPGVPSKSSSVLFRNLGDGRFEELADAGPGVAETHSSRGAAFGDFDNDGDVDILIVNMNEPPSLLRNDVIGSNHWLKVLLVGASSNRSAIGAQVAVRFEHASRERKEAQAVLAQSSYLSVNDRRLHFGLGSATSASLEIQWPNGARESIPNVAADQLVTVREGAGVVRTERFGKSAAR
jgi:hypothetical protein